VLTEVSGSSLRIHLARNTYRKVNVKAYVTYISLDRISASSASSVFSEGTIKSSSLDISASSASSIEIAIDTDRLELDASSAANIRLEGKAATLNLEVSSAGEIDAYNVQSETVTARASSAGSAKVSVSKDLDAHASSAGSIRYRGTPSRTNTGSSSGGSVKKSN
jgi:Putative auto-transporter adhesin, head GIN domain